MGGHLLPEGTSSGAGPSLTSQGNVIQAESSPAIPNASGTVPTKILIYQNVLSFLKDACSTRTLGRSRSEVARLQTTVEGYLLSMTADNVVSGIVASPAHRKILLELSSKLDLENDPRLRAALRGDEEHIVALIVSILDSKSAQDNVLNLEGDSAQCFLDVIQDALNRGFLMAQEHSRQARRIVRKLSESCDKLPSSLFIPGVTGREDHPTFAGGFGDIYRASYGTKIVALKHMRHFIQSSDPEIRDIRLKLCREALVWKDLRHPHILPFLGIDRESFPPSLCAVSPWMEHGTVLKYLQNHGRGNVDKLLYEVAQGLEYLHSRNIVHGDLRGANILINEDWSACLADFGLSVFANATTSMHTSTRAGSLYWMAPELIDPDRFGCKFARTKASDVYAFACVCLELYSGQPPFAEFSQAAALLKVVNGDRPTRPSTSPAMSDELWRHVNAYWAEESMTRPVAEVVVQEMIWPPPRKPKYLRPLPPVPVPRPAPPISPSEPASTPSSPPLYVSPQGSPPGYDTADYQRVELTPFKVAQMEKASQQGPSREMDLKHIMKLVGKASGRTLLNQTVVLTDGIQTLFERARQRDVIKREAFVKQLAEYSEGRRLHDQDAVFHRTRPESPESPDPDEIITLPEFVKETPPTHVLDDLDPLPVTPPNIPSKPTLRPRRPSLPWLRISPSLSTLRYQLCNPKSTSSIPLPGSDSDVNVASAGPKTSSPFHRRMRSASVNKPVRGQSAQEGEIKTATPVRERVRDAFVTAASASGSKTDAAFRGLWRRVKPPAIDTDDAKSNSSFSIGRPSEYDLDDIPASPLDGYHATTDEPKTTADEPASITKEPEATEAPPVGDALLSPAKRRSNPDTTHHVPPDEDMWRLFECEFGTTNAAQLIEALAMTPPEGLNNSVIQDLHKKCLESQEVILTQIPWASASAERSRVVKNEESSENSSEGDKTLEPPALTWEEELLLEMLAANERLLAALRTYDDLMRVAAKREAEQQQDATESTSSADTQASPSSSRQRPHAFSALPAPGRVPSTQLPAAPHALNDGQPVSEDLQPSYPTKVRALKAFTADPDDPDEISFGVGDILDILDQQGKWWLVQNADGSAGIASSDYFSVLDGEDRQTGSARSSAGALPVYPYGSSENGRSFSQEEIFDVVEKQIQWWKAEKSYGSSSVLSSDIDYCSISGSEPETFQYKAQALYPYTADADDPRELSFRQGEILDIGDKRADWWQARNANGLIGIAPSNYLQLL